MTKKLSGTSQRVADGPILRVFREIADDQCGTARQVVFRVSEITGIGPDALYDQIRKGACARSSAKIMQALCAARGVTSLSISEICTISGEA